MTSEGNFSRQPLPVVVKLLHRDGPHNQHEVCLAAKDPPPRGRDFRQRPGIACRQIDTRGEPRLPGQHGLSPLGIAWLSHAENDKSALTIELANQAIRGLERGGSLRESSLRDP